MRGVIEPPSHYGPLRRKAFMVGFLNGHSNGQLEGARQTRDAYRTDFERTLAILREENSTMRRMFEAAALRADNLAAEMARQIVLAQAPPHPALVSAEAPRTSRDPIHGLGNVFAPVPLGDPDGTYATEEEASLLFPSTAGTEGEAVSGT